MKDLPIKNLTFPIGLLEKAFGNCQVKLEKCDNDPRLSYADHIRLRRKSVKFETEDDDKENSLYEGNSTQISFENCSLSTFNLVLVHDKIIEEGWTEKNGRPVYFANSSNFVKVEMDKKTEILDKEDSSNESEPEPEPDPIPMPIRPLDIVNEIRKVRGKYQCGFCKKGFTLFYNVRRHQTQSCIVKSALDRESIRPSHTPSTSLKRQISRISAFNGVNHHQSNINSSKNQYKVKSEDDEECKLNTDDAYIIESESGKLQCGYCKCWFITRYNVVAHQMTTCPAKGEENNVGPWKCDLCNKTFVYKKSLQIHTQEIHLRIKPYKCSICQKRFSRAYSLHEHLAVHTGERRFQCPLCPMRFTRQSTLCEHRKVHSKVKPFKCTVCARRFGRRTGLAQHMVIHTGERPYRCQICDRRFSRKKAVNAHMRTHTGEKPYQCHVCHLRFGRKDNMFLHIIRKHPNMQSNIPNSKTSKNEDIIEQILPD